MCKKVITIFTIFFLGKIQAQLCSCGGSVQQIITNPSTYPSQDLLTSVFNIPQVPSVSNYLADTLQLLIVSDLIASNLNPRRIVSPCSLPSVSSVCETLPPSMFVPRTDYYPPCTPLIDIVQPSYHYIEPLPKLYGLTDILPSAPNTASICNSEVIPANAKFVGSPFQIGSFGPCNDLPELLEQVTEIMYPSTVQPCNAGYSPPSVPLTNFNLEPIPYTGVNYFY